MPHIDLGVADTELPGITGPLRYRPNTAKPLGELAEVLLRAPNSLSPGERELIATHVSALNECHFCTSSHAAFAAAQEEGSPPVDHVGGEVPGAAVSSNHPALLHIAGAVQRGGKQVTASLVEAARTAGASDVEIHDTVLIAAAFCMYNRYVDGLATFAPDDPEVYAAQAERIVTYGYVEAGRPPEQALAGSQRASDNGGR